jgi:hypothetical protein
LEQRLIHWLDGGNRHFSAAVRSVAPPSEFELQSPPADEPLQGRDPRPIFLHGRGDRDIIVERTDLVPFDPDIRQSDVACGAANPATVTHSDLVAGCS